MLIPLILSMRVSFYEYSGVGDMVFIGFENFRKLLFHPTYSERFFNAVGNTFKFFGYTMVFQNVTALLIALALTRGLKLTRSEEHTSELQSRGHLVCRLLLEKKKKQTEPS